MGQSTTAAKNSMEYPLLFFHLLSWAAAAFMAEAGRVPEAVALRPSYESAELDLELLGATSSAPIKDDSRMISTKVREVAYRSYRGCECWSRVGDLSRCFASTLESEVSLRLLLGSSLPFG